MFRPSIPQKIRTNGLELRLRKIPELCRFFSKFALFRKLLFCRPVNLPVTVKNSANNSECPAMLITQFPKDSLRFQKLTSHEIFKKIGKSYFYAFSRGQNITFFSLAQVGDMLFRCGWGQTLSTQPVYLLTKSHFRISATRFIRLRNVSFFGHR